jgi:hypothetical protein
LKSDARALKARAQDLARARASGIDTRALAAAERKSADQRLKQASKLAKATESELKITQELVASAKTEGASVAALAGWRAEIAKLEARETALKAELSALRAASDLL